MNKDLVLELINALTILPGVGKKSAQRMALYLLDKNKDGARILANTLADAVDNIQRCTSCRMLTSNEVCNLCEDNSRDESYKQWLFACITGALWIIYIYRLH